jgi:hypothetical protein
MLYVVGSGDEHRAKVANELAFYVVFFVRMVSSARRLAFGVFPLAFTVPPKKGCESAGGEEDLYNRVMMSPESLVKIVDLNLKMRLLT